MKHFLKVSLAFSLVCILLLPALLLPTTADSSVSVGKEQILDANRRNYVNAMLDYYLSGRGDKAVGEALQRGKIALFFFEGASNHVLYGDELCDYDRYRFGAVCIVVKLVSGKPQITFFGDECSTIPDNPRAGSTKAESVATLLDGVYPIVNCNHYGYAALHIPAYDWGTSVLCWQGGHYTDACYGINIHNRDTDAITPYTKNSLGCLLVGKTAAVSRQYNDFMLAATGIQNARSASFSEVAKDAGCVVIDRALYRKELLDIYDSGAGDQAQVVNQIIGYTNRVNGEARKYIPTSNEPVIEPAESSEESKPVEESKPTEESKEVSEPTEESRTCSEMSEETESASEPVEESKTTSEPPAESDPPAESEPSEMSDATSEPAEESRTEMSEETESTSEPAEESKTVSELLAESKPTEESEPISEPAKDNKPASSPLWIVLIVVSSVLIIAEGVLIAWALRKKK